MSLTGAEFLIQFVSGAVMMAFLVASLLFLRFWKQTQDRFFLIFSVAFAVLGLERWIVLWTNPTDLTPTYEYLIRLVAYLCLLWAIIDKNRKAS